MENINPNTGIPQKQVNHGPDLPNNPTELLKILIRKTEANNNFLHSIAINNEITADRMSRVEKRERIKFWLQATIKIITIIWLVWLFLNFESILSTTTEKVVEALGPFMANSLSGGASAAIDPENIQNILQGLDLGAILGGGQ